MWWGLYLIALSVGAWWSIVGPIVMTVLLLRVSGVALMEKHIGKRRPRNTTRIFRRTSAFVPLPRKALRGGSGPGRSRSVPCAAG